MLENGNKCPECGAEIGETVNARRETEVGTPFCSADPSWARRKLWALRLKVIGNLASLAMGLVWARRGQMATFSEIDHVWLLCLAGLCMVSLWWLLAEPKPGKLGMELSELSITIHVATVIVSAFYLTLLVVNLISAGSFFKRETEVRICGVSCAVWFALQNLICFRALFGMSALTVARRRWTLWMFGAVIASYTLTGVYLSLERKLNIDAFATSFGVIPPQAFHDLFTSVKYSKAGLIHVPLFIVYMLLLLQMHSQISNSISRRGEDESRWIE